MLQSISPVFARMLTTSTTKRLDLSPDPLDAIQLMLAFLYSGQYDPDKTVRLTMHIRVYTMAEKYAMDTLTQAVTERVKHLISDGLRRDPRIPIPFMKGLRYNYWDDDDLTGAVEMLWYEPGPPCWALRELVMKAAVVRKRQLLLLPRFRELVRGGTEFVVLLMCDGVVYVGD
ncbi:hypothetical protein MMC30_006188 [Trapelia coarctata]|nr:hypothetical protein [Trapelia coarctata]